ncbi:DUF952 domain-containing protein [Rhizobium lemnae]|uniref:DUF952 domain-containing protein n=1 Tax=Rhizobium lemnae TaxID=1214924 RepID=A0ABV8E948_9HYPH|nr:DUF952 domain-containing protein [Rhizobium lemnae]MCJ8506339.1 DUF952 domain-containing protein [Rhizobium lemnae]
MSHVIYKIVPEPLWVSAEQSGRFEGAPVDLTDGFIHFSTASQVRETVARHFKGQTGLLLVAIDADRLGGQLKYEPSRGGDLFPHLYANLMLDTVIWKRPLPVGPDGSHVFPEELV